MKKEVMVMDYSWLDGYLLKKPGCEKDFKAEWQWWRYRVGGRLFAALLCPGEQYSPLYAGKHLLNLKCEPMLSEFYRTQFSEVLPGFYTDKRCWISVDLDGELPPALLREMCDHSYEQVWERLTRRVRQEIMQASAPSQSDEKR